MGGDLTVESEAERGTTVTLSLPIVERRARPRSRLKRRGRVLVVDDEPNIRRTISTFLVRHGFDVHTASDGEEAVGRVELARHEPYQTVVLDVVMPRRDGVAAAAAIRELAPSTRIVLLTGIVADPAMERTVLSSEADHKISKPLNLQRLLEIIEESGAPK
jgi:DNA-binding response OmpR family regulator